MSDNDVNISPNQLIANGSMIFESKSKSRVNVVKTGVKDPVVTERIWADLRLHENKILQKKSKCKKIGTFNDR